MAQLTRPRKKIGELAEVLNPAKVYPAYLGEDYDGIGQYVAVTFSRSSTASSVKARISVGDFGTGQRIPRGAPVAVFVNRGLVEILSLGFKPGDTFGVGDT